MNERLINVGILAGSLAVAIALAEVAVRMFGKVVMMPTQYTTDSLVVYRLKPNVRGHAVQPGVMDYRWTTNAQSQRANREYTIPKSPGTKRIVALGDSYTFGIGVDDSLTWVARLEPEMKLACDGPVEVINTGAGGYGTSQELEIFERFGEAYQPDVVLLGFMTNDFDDNMQYPLHVIEGDSAVPKPVAERPKLLAAKRVTEMIPGYTWLITHSALVNGMRQVYFAVKRRASPGTQQAIGVSVEKPPDARAVTLMRALLRRLKVHVEASNAKLLVVLMLDENSARHYYDGNRDKAAALGAMRQLCAELALDCVDVGERLLKYAPRDRLEGFYIQGDGHFTVAGNLMTLAAVLPRVTQLMDCDPATMLQRAGVAR